MTVSSLQGTRWKAWLAGGLLALGAAGSPAADFDPQRHAEARRLVAELAERGIDRDWLEAAMISAEYRQSVLDAMGGAAERRLTWPEYRAIFLDETRIANGAAFIEAHEAAFARAQADYGVPPEVIAAILGVETRYGEITGRHRVLDSLSTLAFHHPSRGRFFRGELAAFLEIAFEQQRAPGSLTGSYAGAMGYPQFIPTSYRAYAVDFDDDGLRDLWTNPVDAIGSVANYFAEHGWRPDAPIYHAVEGPATPPEGIEFNRAARPPAVPAAALAAAGLEIPDALSDEHRLLPVALEGGEDTWRYVLGEQNFYVITRYNHSHLYAMAVTELAEAIAEARGREAGWLEAADTLPEEAS
ncbi:lytic murein transglycosylase B [Halomonas sp. CS7]|uniref:Lytic murein transglycosylase B n=1 Tax=Halomonas pelophila TaxID=3151122 RepID=A0ABV1N8V0_9GAMM